MTAAPQTVAIREVAGMMEVPARRTCGDGGEAEVVREDTSACPGGARRGTGPSPQRQIEERTSGQATSQQGDAAPGKDAWPKAITRGGERGVVGRRSPEERRGSRKGDLCHRECDTLRGNALKRQRTFYHLSTPICQIFSPLHNRLTTNPARIIAGPIPQHGHQDTQQSVAKSA